ncbi:MAG: FxsA family protein [Dichotomicrobium sp.]
MFLIFFVIFVATPILEIVLFIEIGGLIGVAPTILIVILTAIAGSILLRLQGGAVIQRTQQALRAGEVPVDPVIDGISLMMAGALLLTPGFFTDTVGFLLFVPPFRRWLARRIFAHMVRSGNVFVAGGGPEDRGAPPGGRRGRDDGRHRGSRDDAIIDVEYEPVNDEPREDERSRKQDESGDDSEYPRSRSSPWRK